MKKIFTIIFTVFTTLQAMAQVTVSGPACVRPGISYQYTIGGTFNSTSTMQVCANGGVIAQTSNSCTGTGSPVSLVNIIWTAGASSPNLSIVSSSGNANLNINISSAINPGTIDATVLSQSIAFNSIPAAITCSVATQGYCNPNYSYSWEQSGNCIQWTPITGANAQNLTISTALVSTTYYRRKVTEVITGSIAYTNTASVLVAADLTGH